MAILVTGGAGYIGSHTCVELLNQGYEIVIIDNLVNSKRKVIDNIKTITNKSVTFYQADLENEHVLEEIFQKHNIQAVIHFAALKSISESIEMPIQYYSNNLIGFLILCSKMQKYHVKKLIFSSSATVYGDPETVPIKEDFPIKSNNPYGLSKVIIENILHDMYKADNEWSIAILRYFNPVGAHSSGLIGEEPNGVPNNLVPYIAKVAKGELEFVNIFGADYPTSDGTGVRDYIHVVDLSIGHIRAIDKVLQSTGIDIYNLGTGKGNSVSEVIKVFEKASNRKINYRIVPRRKGDIAICYADTTKANKMLKWKAEKNLEDMCRDTWNFMERL